MKKTVFLLIIFLNSVYAVSSPAKEAISELSTAHSDVNDIHKKQLETIKNHKTLLGVMLKDSKESIFEYERIINLEYVKDVLEFDKEGN